MEYYVPVKIQYSPVSTAMMPNQDMKEAANQQTYRNTVTRKLASTKVGNQNEVWPPPAAAIVNQCQCLFLEYIRRKYSIK
jgi:hypothetical protein